MINNPKVGDKVWLDNTDFCESADMIREPQTIESVTPIPVTDEHGKWFTSYAIYLIGGRFVYTEEDLRRADD